eukprot:4590453-Alexandrium_andersonii.AAC.1
MTSVPPAAPIGAAPANDSRGRPASRRAGQRTRSATNPPKAAPGYTQTTLDRYVGPVSTSAFQQ